MYFESVEQLLHMEGHGVFVWTVMLVALTVMVGLLVLPWRREKATLREIAGEVRRQQRATTEL